MTKQELQAENQRLMDALEEAHDHLQKLKTLLSEALGYEPEEDQEEEDDQP